MDREYTCLIGLRRSLASTWNHKLADAASLEAALVDLRFGSRLPLCGFVVARDEGIHVLAHLRDRNIESAMEDHISTVELQGTELNWKCNFR